MIMKIHIQEVASNVKKRNYVYAGLLLLASCSMYLHFTFKLFSIYNDSPTIEPTFISTSDNLIFSI
jgi:hypothetical protein